MGKKKTGDVHNPPASRPQRKLLRDKEIRAYYKEGFSMNQITQFGFSKQTIFRAIHQGRLKIRK